MAYQVLARKWRPKSFEELVGQEHVVRALTHALDENRLHHAYLFTGTRGVGKTTLARILAKSLNCETGISSKPCGVCGACVEINEGRFVDLLEVDAATNTRVEEMRTLLENAVYAPTRARFKVYVIDEVHMLSTAAFNAMLKTLEEPPEHVKFILATTDPQKIPVTVLSRCLQFNLKQMTLASTVFQMKRILKEENIPFEEAALPFIALAGKGSMRDALSLLDQAIAFGAGEIKKEWVTQMLGAVESDFLFRILNAFKEENAPELLNITENLSARAIPFSTVLQELGLLLTRLQILQFAPQSFEDDPEIESLRQWAKAFSPEWIQLAYQILTLGREDLPLSPDEESGFLMTLLRVHAFSPFESGVENKVNPPKENVPNAAAAIVESLKENEKNRALTVGKKQEIKETPKEEAKDLILKEIDASNWNQLVTELKVQGFALLLAQNAQALKISNQEVKLRVSPQNEVLFTAQKSLESDLRRYFNNPLLRLVLEKGDPQTRTLADVAAAEKEALAQKTKESLKNDPFIQSAVEELDARIDWETVRALE